METHTKVQLVLILHRAGSQHAACKMHCDERACNSHKSEIEKCPYMLSACKPDIVPDVLTP